MPVFSIPSLVFLGSVLAAFGAFAVTLIGVSLYTMIPAAAAKPAVKREVIPARRAEATLAR